MGGEIIKTRHKSAKKHGNRFWMLSWGHSFVMLTDQHGEIYWCFHPSSASSCAASFPVRETYLVGGGRVSSFFPNQTYMNHGTVAP